MIFSIEAITSNLDQINDLTVVEGGVENGIKGIHSQFRFNGFVKKCISI